jgi:MFS family permease
MWVAYVINYADRSVLFSIFPLLKSQLHLSNAQLGLSSSLFIWVYGFSSLLAGQIGDRISRPLLVVASLFLWSCTTILTGMASSAWMLLACRAFTGVTEALFMPAAVVVTAYAHSDRYRSLAVGVLTSAQMIGLISGGWYGGFAGQEFGWREAFFSLGALGLLYSIPLRIFLKDTHERVAARPADSMGTGNRLALVEVVKVPTYRWLCLCFPAYTSMLWLLYTWLPDLLYERFPLTLAQAGLIATAYAQGATFLGLLAGGAISDRLYMRTKAGRFWTLCAGILFSSPWAILIAYTHSLLVLKVAACGFGFGTGIFMANFFVSAFEVVPENTRASAVGVINCIGTPFSGALVVLAGVWKTTIGIPHLLSYAAATSMFFALLLIVAVKLRFQEDYQRCHSPRFQPASK